MSYEDLTAEILEDPTFTIVGDDMETVIDGAITTSQEDYISWDIGGGQIVAYHNPSFVQPSLTDYEIENLVREQVTKTRDLNLLNIATNMCMEVYIIKGDIKKLAFLSFSTEGFKERGCYILKNSSSIYPQTWEGGLFSGNINPNDPSVWYKVLKPLFKEFTILKGAINGKHPPSNYGIIPATDMNTISKYQVRYFGFRLSKPGESYNVDTTYNTNKYDGSDWVLTRVASVIKLLLEFEPKLKLTIGLVDLVKAIYDTYLNPDPYIPSSLEQLSSEEIQKFTNEVTIPEHIPKDLENIKTAYFIDQVSLIERLLGPISMSIYQLNDRLIYLFGDLHVPTGPIEAGVYVTLENFFEYFFHNSPLTCDLFLETYAFLNVPHNEHFDEYKSQLFYDTEAPIDELGVIIRKYAECLGGNKERCDKFGNVRFHNIDFRRISNIFYNMYGIRNLLTHVFEKDPEGLSRYFDNRYRYGIALDALIIGDLEGASEQFKIIYQDIPGMSQHYDVEVLSKLSSYDKLGKQFDKIHNTDKVREHFSEEFNKLLSDTIPPTDSSQEELLQLLHAFHFEFEILFMDAYAIGRIIKSLFLYTKNIAFVYAGAIHVDTYCHILESLYGAEKIVDIKSYSKYVDISMIDRERIFRELTETMFLQ